MTYLLKLLPTFTLDAIVPSTDYASSATDFINTPVGGLIAGALVGAVAVASYLISRHIHNKKK